MTTSLDAKLVPAVIKLLAKFGATAQIKRVTAGTFNPTTGEYDSSLETGTQTWSVKALPPSNYVKYWKEGEPVLSEQLQSGIQGGSLSFTPQNGDFLLIGNEKWVITEATPIYSGDAICLWMFQLRR